MCCQCYNNFKKSAVKLEKLNGIALDEMFSKGRPLTESSSGNYECIITDLAPDTEYHVRLMIQKEGKLSLDVTYVNFRTEKVRQEAPTAADVSINYEQETLENKASYDLEYAASKDAQSWTTIRQGGKVRLIGLLNNIRENGGSVPVYIRKKASSSMSASEAVLVANLQTQAIPEESNKPNIDYRKEKITISSSLQYVIVNGTNTSPSWTSAKMGSESGISITDIISSDHESTVYYRYAASNKDKKFAGKPKSITILKRTAAPAAITENEVKITGTTITINRTNPENDIEYGYRDVDSDGAFTWIDGTKIQGLYPAHGYQVTGRIKAKENAFASERTEPLNVSTKDTLRIVGNGTQKWDAKGTYGVSLAQIPVSLASGYGVYNGANQPVAGTWSWEPENSSSASGIYPNVKDNKAYTVKFTPTDASASYDRTLTDSVVPEISKYPLNFSVAVKDKTYDGTTNADISSVTFDNVTLNRGTDYTVTASFDDASVGNGKNITATVTVVIKSTNYDEITLTVNVNATNKLAPTVTAPTANALTYNGAEQALVTAGKTTGGTMLYRLDDSKWSEQLPTAKNAGKYTVWYKVQGSAEYADVAEQSLTVTVAKKAVTVTALGKSAYTGSTAPDLSSPKADKNYKVEGLVGADTLSGTVTLTYGQTPDMSKTGTTAINITGTLSNDNYAITYVPGTLTVSNQPSGGGASGGGGGGAAPAPTPADSDVITVKEDTKDNTTSKPGAETDTTTTTKTTVKNTTTETTKNEQGQDVSKTTASVSKDLGDKLLDQAVSNKSDTIEITVKSSEANNGSGAGSTGAVDSVKETEVELPKATVNAIAKDTNADLVIKTDNGEVVLDNKTLETIAGAANGDTVTIVVGENTQLKETQKPAEKIVGKNGTLFDLVAKIGEKHLHQFEGGKAYVTLPMPDKLKGKDILVIYIDDNGLCRILNHSVEKIGAEDYIRFTTTRFSTFAVVDKDEAERLIKEQNAAHVKELMQSAKFKVTTTKTSKKSVKVQVAAKSSKTMISDIKSLGYTVKYQFYRSTKKDAGYKLRKTSSKNSFISTKGAKGRKYYYKARVLVYDGSKLVAKSALKQCSYGARR